MIQLIGDLHIDQKDETIIEKILNLKSYLDTDSEKVIILGDVFHNRKNISNLAIKELQKVFNDIDKEIYIIVGNHDCRFKNTISVNSLSVFKDIKNVHIVEKPIEIDDFILIPWMCDENYQDCLDAINDTNKKYCCGHFDIQTFEMTRGIQCVSGLKLSTFSKFDKVFSGHYHLRQEKNNIIYVGSMVQNSWTDFENQKGWYTVSDSIEFFEGSKQIYKHLIIENENSDFDIKEFENCHIKCYHKKQLSKSQFEKLEELKVNSRSYKIYDESAIIINQEVDEDVEFEEMIEEYLKLQEMEDNFKKDVYEYLILKNKEIGS